MKVKTSTLTGHALDWAVAKCEDFKDGSAIIVLWNNLVTKIIPGDYETSDVYTSYSPSTDWAVGGPIYEADKQMHLGYDEAAGWCCSHTDRYVVFDDDGDVSEWRCPNGNGPTPLIAIMRCYVAHKLGEEVEIPEELVKAKS